MKKIACVGYHGTGASVIDDLFRECDNVCQGKYECEARFLQDPDGISDLEYHLVENPHRLSSTIAIKRFIRLSEQVNRQYSMIFGKEWLELAKEYAESLAVVKYSGWWSGDLQFIGYLPKKIYLLKRIINKMMPKPIRKPAYYNYFPNLYTYHSRLSEAEFLKKTQTFIEKLCINMNPEKKDFVLLDQFISAINPSRYIRYTSDLKVIIVDRDPRDLFLQGVLRKGHVLPKTAHEFCLVYRNNRIIKGDIPSNCLYLKFEDLIYHYDVFIQKVFDFVGISKEHHIAPKTRFNPDVSIKGTQLWKKYPEFMESIRIIENELPEFLYSYPL